MEKLKTLKDIYENYEETCSGRDSLDELKQEAIKWIKELDHDGNWKDEKTKNCVGFTENSNYHEHGSVREWIKHFFNITEEELK